MHGRARESSDAGIVQEIYEAGSVCVCDAGGVGERDPANRIFPEQDEIGDGGEQGDRGEVCWRSATNDERHTDATGCGAQDSQCGAWNGVWNCERGRGGYACDTTLATA